MWHDVVNPIYIYTHTHTHAAGGCSASTCVFGCVMYCDRYELAYGPGSHEHD